MDEQTIQRFWHDHACGDAQVGGLRERFQGDYEKFFTDYDEFRYQNERHLAACIDALNVSGKQVLEIGLGEGADSERLIRNGARWSGVDLTAESIARLQTRLTLRQLPYEELRQGSVLDLPFADGTFDIVFSHGVLHHVPEIKQAQKEIHRVLRPGGELVIMVYAKWSLNYLVSISSDPPGCASDGLPARSRRPAEVGSVGGNAGRASQQRQAVRALPLPATGGVRPPQHRRARQPVRPGV